MDELVVLRGIERLAIVLGGIVVVYLGYRLYLRGAGSSRTQVDFSSQFMKFAASGTGPGLLFMVFGTAILVCSLIFGGVISKSSIATPDAVLTRDAESATNAGVPGGAQSDARQPSATAPAIPVRIPNAQDPSPDATTVSRPAPATPAGETVPAIRDDRRPRWEDSAARRAARDLSATAGSIGEQTMRRIPPATR